MEYKNIIEEYKNKGGILDVLKAIQMEFGYISEEAIRKVAEVYGKYPSQVYETATFYSMLNLEKKVNHVIEICGSTCCDASDNLKITNAIISELGIGFDEVTKDKKWLFKRCECLGRCDTAPNVLIDGVLYSNAKIEEVIEVLRKAGK